MRKIAPKLGTDCPKRRKIIHEGRAYSIALEATGWRLRSRTRYANVDFRTRTANFVEATRRAKEHLSQLQHVPQVARRGGGSLSALCATYLKTPKKTKERPAKINVSRLKTVCRLALERELESVTCREVGPALWHRYQELALKAAGRKFDYATRHRENIPINSTIRCARAIFTPAMLRVYRAAGFVLNDDCAAVTTLPEPEVIREAQDDSRLLEAWAALRETDIRLWLTVGLARFAGMRRDEIDSCRAGWIKDGFVILRDRPEEQFFTKTGKSYRAQIISRSLREYLDAFVATNPADAHVVPDPKTDRWNWFRFEPQEWIRRHGISARKPLHELRALYATELKRVTEDAVAAHLAGVKAAQENLGHTTSRTTEKSYLRH